MLEHRFAFHDDPSCRKCNATACQASDPSLQAAARRTFLAVKIAAAKTDKQRAPGAVAEIGDDDRGVAEMGMDDVEPVGVERLSRLAAQAEIIASRINNAAFDAAPRKAFDLRFHESAKMWPSRIGPHVGYMQDAHAIKRPTTSGATSQKPEAATRD